MNLHNFSNIKEYAPPYIAISRLQEALKLLATRSFNQITLGEFTSRNFSKPDAFQTIAALKFLGLIHDDGSKTDNLTKLQLMGEDRVKGLQEIVKSAYSKLFTITPDVNKLSRQELHNEFIAVYGISPRLANTAVPAFVWLCKEAGIEVSAEVKSRQHHVSAKARISQAAMPIRKSLSHGIVGASNQGYEIPFGNIKLVIPNTNKAITALLGGKFKEVADRLSELSKTLEEDH